VEFLTAALFVVNFFYFGISVKFFAYTALECGLLVGTFTDLAHFIIPDEITVGGLAAGLVLSSAFPALFDTASHKTAFLLSLWGAAVGASFIYATGLLGEWLFKKEAMGGGDVKLMAMIGSFIGWKLVILVFFMAPFFGALVGLYIKFVKKKDIIPYGPYLSLATVVAILWGDKILRRLLCCGI
jgi:leader peptidase (prepilin peptidase)/N-methyltransferase